MEPKTFIVIGVAHSGTSMVCGVLRHLGITFGELSERWNDHSEDVDLVHAMDNPRLLREMLDERNAKYPIWGFKHPIVWRKIGALDQFRNPHLIFIWRDPFAISLRRRKGHDALTQRMGVVREVCQHYEQIARIAASTNHPKILLSYEKCLMFPERCLEEIAGFLEVEPTPEQRQAVLDYIAPEANYPSLKVGNKRKTFDILLFKGTEEFDEPSHRLELLDSYETALAWLEDNHEAFGVREAYIKDSTGHTWGHFEYPGDS